MSVSLNKYRLIMFIKCGSKYKIDLELLHTTEEGVKSFIFKLNYSWVI